MTKRRFGVSHVPHPLFTPYLVTDSYVQRDKVEGFKSPQMGERAQVTLILRNSCKGVVCWTKGKILYLCFTISYT